MEYRRAYIPGGTYFFTVVTYQRRPIFSSPDAVDTLRNAFQYTLARMPFTIVASVILPEHLHFIWTLPPGDQQLFNPLAVDQKPFHPPLASPRNGQRQSIAPQKR